MAESSYIFSETQFQSELERLQALEKVSDPASQRQILAVGWYEGWKCLGVGAGAGSIMRWMSEKVGSSGKVTAVNFDSRFVESTSLSNVEMITADIDRVTLTDRF